MAKKHTTESSKLWMGRYKAQCAITDKLKEQNEEYEQEINELRSTIIRIHNQAQLAGDFPSRQNMKDIVDLCDLVL